MANEAHKEPTMEEILASIRKIISDDAAAPASAPEPEPEIANDEEDDVSLEEVMFDDDIREEATEPEAAEEFEMESFEIEDFSAEEPPEAAPEPAVLGATGPTRRSATPGQLPGTSCTWSIQP